MKRRIRSFLVATSIAALACATFAQGVPSRTAAAMEDGSRVVVRFKPDAAIVRTHAFKAGDWTTHGRTMQDRASALAARHGLTMVAVRGVTERVQVVRAEGVSARALAARLARDPDVESVVPDRRMRRALVPNDSRYLTVAANPGPAVGQWYLRPPAAPVVSSIDAESAWDNTTGSASVIVAVIDTGVRYEHPDLAGKLLPGYDMISDAAVANDGGVRDSDANDPGDWVTDAEVNQVGGTFYHCTTPDSNGVYTGETSSWHGTQVAGIVGAATNNGNGMAGAGWNVRVLPVRVLGKCFGYTSDIAAGIRWAAGLSVPGVPPNPNPARVINLSLGGGGPCDGEEAPAISEAVAAGVVVVAAAGNTSGQAAGSPANCPGAIGVAGLRHVGTKVGFSDVGSAISIAAPGGNCVNTGASQPCLYPILTTVNTGTTTPNTNPITGSTYTDAFNASVGTSFSSPLVAATAALMFSAQPALTPSGVRAGLQAAARPFPQPAPGDTVPLCHAPNGTDQLECYCTTSTCGAGMLDAGAAVRAVLGVSLSIAVSPAAPIAAQVVTLDSTASTVASGRTIASRQWAIVDGGGIVSSFNDAANGVATSLTPSAAGTFTVKLTITDDRGVAASKTQSVTVAGNGTAPPPASSGGGGGTMSWGWLMALLAGTALLVERVGTRTTRRRR